MQRGAAGGIARLAVGGRVMRRRCAPRWCGVAAAALGLALMGFGIHRGEVLVVLTKAVNICLECIGIG